MVDVGVGNGLWLDKEPNTSGLEVLVACIDFGESTANTLLLELRPIAGGAPALVCCGRKGLADDPVLANRLA